MAKRRILTDLHVDGDVGIGTTSPSDELHVIGDIQASQTLKAIKFQSTAVNAGVNTLQLGRSDNNSYWHVNHAGDDFRLWNSDGSGTDILLSVDAGGADKSNKVGIGTATPSEKLHVNGNIRLGDGTTGDNTVKAYYNDGSHARLHGYGLYFDRGESYIRPTTNGDKNLNIGHTTNVWNNLKIDSELIRINSMAGHESEGQIRFGRYDGNSTRYNRLTNYVSSTEGSNYMQFEIHNGTENSTVDVMTLKGNGDVKFSDYGSGTHTGTLAYKLGVDSSGNIIESAVGSGAVDGSGTANYVTKWTDGDTIGDSVIYDNGTNVGIGTTTPSAKLDVRGDYFQRPSSNTSAVWVLADSGGTTRSRFDLNASGSSSLLLRDSGGTYNVTINSDGNSYLNGGNVGIGTASPAEKLHVDGNVKADSFIKDGGTSSQFLKADGSVDSTVYTGDQDLSGLLLNTTDTFTGTLSITANSTPFIFAESGHTGTGQHWRHVLDGGNMRYDVCTDGDGLFTPYIKPFKMHANGNISFPEYGAGLLKTNGAGLISLDTNTYLTSADIGSFVDGSGTAGKIMKWSDSDTATDSIISEVSSEIGIGVAAPKAKLHVDGAVIVGDDQTTSQTDLAEMKGAIRYWEETVSGGYVYSYCDMVMKTGCNYSWVNIVTNKNQCI
jgi:hypothetical protein